MDTFVNLHHIIDNPPVFKGWKIQSKKSITVRKIIGAIYKPGCSSLNIFDIVNVLSKDW